MQIQIALIRQEDMFDAALLVDGKFRRSFTGQDATLVINRALATLLAGLPEGSEILVNVVVEAPKEPASGPEAPK